MPRKKVINKKYTNDPKNKTKKYTCKTSSNKPIRRITKRNCKQDLLMQSLINFFSTKKNMNIILPIINGKSKISLRLIDWFVTNYCKKNTVRYYIKDTSGSRKQFDVHLNYKTQLKSFSKKQFDPFRRDERIEFEYNRDEKLALITTVGQLNFFRWIIKSNILDYITKNLGNIEKDMNSITRKNRIKYINIKNKQKKGNGTEITIAQRKRRQLCVSATKSISKHVATITVNFN